MNRQQKSNFYPGIRCFCWITRQAVPLSITRLECTEPRMYQYSCIWFALAEWYSSGLHVCCCSVDHPSVFFSLFKWFLEILTTGLAHHKTEQTKGSKAIKKITAKLWINKLKIGVIFKMLPRWIVGILVLEFLWFICAIFDVFSNFTWTQIVSHLESTFYCNFSFLSLTHHLYFMPVVIWKLLRLIDCMQNA